MQIPRSHRLWTRLIPVVGLLIFFGLAVDSARQLAMTSDELAHITRGYVLWQNGDLRLQFGHAPLSHRLIGSLLEADAGPDVVALESWPAGDRIDIARELFWTTGLDVETLLWLARIPIVMVALLLVATVVAWSRMWLGRDGMFVALILAIFSPNLLAHASVATTDLVTAATYFGTVFAWWCYWRRPTRLRWLISAVLLGLALSAKMTTVLLVPVLFLLAFVTWRRGNPDDSLLRRGLTWLALLPIAGLTMWLVYGFEWRAPDGWPVALPAATYLDSWIRVLTHVSEGHVVFFFGEISAEGWLHYFPITFLIKTPLPVLILLLAGLVALALSWRRQWRTAAFLLLPIGAIGAAAITSRLNIGYRHILPALPFVWLIAASAVALVRHRPVWRALLGVGLAALAISTLWQHPHHLSSFSWLVGGSANGYRYLGDSNLDWGQDLNGLAARVSAESDANWQIAYSGVVDPARVGLAEFVLDPSSFAAANPAEGRYAISANGVQGVIDDRDRFDWFRRTQPDDTIGGSILIYDVESQAQGEWLAQCLDPTPLLSAETAERLVGQSGLRHVTFDCRQSWVWPNAGAPGWWILPQADGWWVSDWLPAEVEVVYRHSASAEGPSYEVVYWPGGDVALRDGVVSAEQDGQSVPLPTLLADTLALDSYQAGGGDWITLWRVASATAEPLSLQAHWQQPDAPPLVADGLGFSSEQWQAGDAFVQRHSFGEATGALFETGLTNYVTGSAEGERLQLPWPNP